MRHSIFSSNGFKKELSLDTYKEDVSKFFDFWRFLRISEDAFIKQAEVGDIILCQSKSKKIKGMMAPIGGGSSAVVDKVCLVVKLQTGVPEKIKDEVHVIRVGNTLDHGIVLQSWEDFRVHKAQKYTDCWYRHLYCNRSDEFLQKTQMFVTKMLNKPYVTRKHEEMDPAL